jgi:hypothetical protein
MRHGCGRPSAGRLRSGRRDSPPHGAGTWSSPPARRSAPGSAGPCSDRWPSSSRLTLFARYTETSAEPVVAVRASGPHGRDVATFSRVKGHWGPGRDVPPALVVDLSRTDRRRARNVSDVPGNHAGGSASLPLAAARLGKKLGLGVVVRTPSAIPKIGFSRRRRRARARPRPELPHDATRPNPTSPVDRLSRTDIDGAGSPGMR